MTQIAISSRAVVHFYSQLLVRFYVILNIEICIQGLIDCVNFILRGGEGVIGNHKHKIVRPSYPHKIHRFHLWFHKRSFFQDLLRIFIPGQSCILQVIDIFIQTDDTLSQLVLLNPESDGDIHENFLSGIRFSVSQDKIHIIDVNISGGAQSKHGPDIHKGDHWIVDLPIIYPHFFMPPW